MGTKKKAEQTKKEPKLLANLFLDFGNRRSQKLTSLWPFIFLCLEMQMQETRVLYRSKGTERIQDSGESFSCAGEHRISKHKPDPKIEEFKQCKFSFFSGENNSMSVNEF